MGELAEFFNKMKEVARERKNEIEPHRVRYATDLLVKRGYTVKWNDIERAIFIYRTEDRKSYVCKLYPYTGWWTGRDIDSGRGVHRLLRKLEKEAK